MSFVNSWTKPLSCRMIAFPKTAMISLGRISHPASRPVPVVPSVSNTMLLVLYVELLHAWELGHKALSPFTLVLSLETDSGWIRVDIIRLIMKIGDRNCRPLRSAFSHGLLLLASFGFPVPSKRMQFDARNRG